MYAKNFQLQLLCCSGLVICYATNVNNNVYNNNQWFGYTQLFNVSISDSHFELVQPVAFVRVINPPFKNFILTQLYTQEHSFCNGTMQFSAAISALLKMLYIHFFLYLFGRSNKAEWEAGCRCFFHCHSCYCYCFHNIFGKWWWNKIHRRNK